MTTKGDETSWRDWLDENGFGLFLMLAVLIAIGGCVLSESRCQIVLRIDDGREQQKDVPPVDRAGKKEAEHE